MPGGASPFPSWLIPALIPAKSRGGQIARPEVILKTPWTSFAKTASPHLRILSGYRADPPLVPRFKDLGQRVAMKVRGHRMEIIVKGKGPASGIVHATVQVHCGRIVRCRAMAVATFLSST